MIFLIHLLILFLITTNGLIFFIYLFFAIFKSSFFYPLLVFLVIISALLELSGLKTTKHAFEFFTGIISIFSDVRRFFYCVVKLMCFFFLLNH